MDPSLVLGAEALGDGDVVAAAGCELRVVATPGHTSDSLSFRLDGPGAGPAVLTGDTVDHAALQAAGLARGGKDGVRVLGKGAFSAKLAFTVAGASKGAIEAVQAAGGTVNVIEVVPAAEKAAALAPAK